MLEWISQVAESANNMYLLLPSLFLLGTLSSIGSGCNLAAIAAIAGYAGMHKHERRFDTLFISLSFLLGTVLSLVLIGALLGYTGEMVLERFGRYSRIAAGFTAIVFGMITLNLLPVKLPQIQQIKIPKRGGLLGAIFFGFILGAGSITCCVACCLPVFPAVLGASIMQGETLKSALIMSFFALGYAFPLGIILLGISLGTWSLAATRMSRAISIFAGVLLLLVGFYFLVTV